MFIWRAHHIWEKKMWVAFAVFDCRQAKKCGVFFHNRRTLHYLVEWLATEGWNLGWLILWAYYDFGELSTQHSTAQHCAHVCNTGKTCNLRLLPLRIVNQLHPFLSYRVRGNQSNRERVIEPSFSPKGRKQCRMASERLSAVIIIQKWLASYSEFQIVLWVF